MTITEKIKQKALELGFDIVGVTDASPVSKDQVNRLLGWLDAGFAGRMMWLHSNLEKRTDPGKLMPGAKSVVVVGLNYKPHNGHPSSVLCHPFSVPLGRVAAFAQYDDYHPFIKKLLRQLADYITEITCPSMQFKICVDSSPLLERALAVRAGLGIVGKNRMLINPRLGPQIFLGEIIANIELEPDKPLNDSCPGCGKCVAACPTGALKPDGSFDATKCISYLTIEANTDVPADLVPKIGNHLFGCAECLLACPYQQKAPIRVNKNFVHHSDRAELNLNDLLSLTEEQFQAKFARSPILRPGLPHLKNIARICLKNMVLDS